MIIYNNCRTALCRLSAAPRRVPFQKSRSTGFHAGLHNALQIRAVRNRLVKETRGNFAAIYEKRPGHSQRVPARNPWSVPREDRRQPPQPDARTQQLLHSGSIQSKFLVEPAFRIADSLDVAHAILPEEPLRLSIQ